YALQLQTAGLMGFFYCGIFPGLTVHVLRMENGSTWLFGLLAIVFTGDTFAYLTGRFFGKRKLLEAVSPKKTVEGCLGGLGGSAVAGLVLGLFFLHDQPLWALVLTALVTGLFAQVGDLFESLLKRIADVKDSGAIMPGHGGILDRVDGVLFAAPIYYVLARFLH
ncbi:MAG: phosphatidate cytidylyltransferase, partial [Bdellovibrionota bacterium]